MADKQKEQANLSSAPSPQSLLFPFADSSILSSAQRTDIDLKGPGLCFHVNNFLAPAEVLHLQTEASKLGFQSLADEYSPDYRQATRVLGMSPTLAEVVYARLMKFLRPTDLEGARPFYLGAEGQWVCTGVNPCFRFTKYEVGGKFERHRDGGYDISEDRRSIFTVMFYLNDVSSGGETLFYDVLSNPASVSSSSSSPSLTTTTIVHSLKPRAGTLVVFPHNLEHQGCEVLEGVKFIARSDLMFRRIESVNNVRMGNQPRFQEAEALYQQSVLLRAQGNPSASTAAYLKAEAIHAEQTPRTKIAPVRFSSSPSLLGVTPALLLVILSFLAPSSSYLDPPFFSFVLSLLTCCKQAKSTLLKDNTVWERLYSLKWEMAPSKQLLPPDSRWYTFFKQRWITLRDFPVVIVDVGFKKTYFSMLGYWTMARSKADIMVSRFDDQRGQGRIGVVDSHLCRHYCRHHGTRQGLNFYSFEPESAEQLLKDEGPWEDESEGPDAPLSLWNKDEASSFLFDAALLREVAHTLVTGYFATNVRLNPDFHPLLLSVPGFISQQERASLLQAMFASAERGQGELTYAALMDREALTAYAANRPNCVVIFFDGPHSSVAVIENFRVVPHSVVRFNSTSQTGSLVAEVTAFRVLLERSPHQKDFGCIIVNGSTEVKSSLAEWAEVLCLPESAPVQGGDILCSLPDIRDIFTSNPALGNVQPLMGPFLCCPLCNREMKHVDQKSLCPQETRPMCQKCLDSACKRHQIPHKAADHRQGFHRLWHGDRWRADESSTLP